MDIIGVTFILTILVWIICIILALFLDTLSEESAPSVVLYTFPANLIYIIKFIYKACIMAFKL